MTRITTTYEEGYIPNQHLSVYLEQVRKLRRENRLEDAVALLLELVDATEEDSLFTGWDVTSAYYEQLAIIYRKRKEYPKEIAILSRYARQRHTYMDSRQQILKERLEKARNLFSKTRSSD